MVSVVTVATEAAFAERLRRSCEKEGLRFYLLGAGQPWGGFGMKYRVLREFLRSGEFGPEDFIVFSDGYDTKCQASADEVRGALEETLGRETHKVLVSAEAYLWPPGTFDTRGFFIRKAPLEQSEREGFLPPRSRYPCSGQWAAKTRVALAFLDRVYRSDEDNDQEALIRDIVAHPYAYVLDLQSRLFQTNVYHLTDHSHGTNPVPERATHPRLNARLGVCSSADERLRVWNLSTGTVPCFLHSNGTGGETLDDIEGAYVGPLRQLAARTAPLSLPDTYQIGEPHEAFSRTHRWPLVRMKSIEEALSNALKNDNGGPLILLQGPLATSNEIKGVAPTVVVSRHVRALSDSAAYDVLLLARSDDECSRCVASSLGLDDLIEPASVGSPVALAIRSGSVAQRILHVLSAGRSLTEVLDSGDFSCLASNPPVLRALPGKKTRGTCGGHSGTAVPLEKVTELKANNKMMLDGVTQADTSWTLRLALCGAVLLIALVLVLFVTTQGRR